MVWKVLTSNLSPDAWALKPEEAVNYNLPYATRR